jgi:glutathione-specific gamma-glutamylcyclotransferase
VIVFNPEAENCNWVFAYGSLMWMPGFEFEQAVPAKLAGYHRRLSVYSFHYRGTPEKPGLVLGLDRGGSCAGLAYQVNAEIWPEVLAYVRAREMISGAYRELVKPIRVKSEVMPVMALTYAVNRAHEQCAPPLSTAETMQYVLQGNGLSGSCAAYVHNTITHLRSMDIHDAGLEKLWPFLQNSDSVQP